MFQRASNYETFEKHSTGQVLQRPDRQVVSYCRGEATSVSIRYLIGLTLLVAILSWWLVFFIVVLTRGWNVSKCPRCQSSRIRRAWPKFVDGMLNRIHISPCRCEACKNRFYRIRGKRVLTNLATRD